MVITSFNVRGPAESIADNIGKGAAWRPVEHNQREKYGDIHD